MKKIKLIIFFLIMSGICFGKMPDYYFFSTKKELQTEDFRNISKIPIYFLKNKIKYASSKEEREILEYKISNSCLTSTLAILMEAIKKNQECYAIIVNTSTPGISHIFPVIYSDNMYRYIDTKITMGGFIINKTAKRKDFSLDIKWININLYKSYTSVITSMEGKECFRKYFYETKRRFPTVVRYMNMEQFYDAYIQK